MKDFRDDPRFPDDAFPPSTPAAEGLDPAPLRACVSAIDARGIPIHGLLVVRRGRRVLEAYGAEEGRALDPDDLRKLHSTTKTFTGMLIGLALADGRIPSLDARAVDFFAPGELAARDPRADRIRIEDLLTMRSGIAYTEGDAADGNVLSTAPCGATAFLTRPLAAEPGVRWNYSTADSQILAEVLRRAHGRSLLDLARARLFEPLGIRAVEWETDAGGTHCGGTGMRLRVRDLARFGWMLLERGRWKGEEVVPAAWVEQATRRHVVATSGWTPGEGYGYHCWTPTLGGFATRGYMGQVMYVFPDRSLVVVFTAALVPPERGDALLDALMREFVLPAVR